MSLIYQQQTSTKILLIFHLALQLNKNIDVTTNDVLRSNTTNNDSDGDYSLDDLANEFLLNETLPSPNSATSAELKKSDTAPDDAGTVILSSSRSTSPPNSLSKSPSSNKFILNESPLESILFSNRLSSQDAAADADCIWKEKSSPLGQIFCTKTNEFQTKATKRISTCLFDRSLHERLTRLIALLPKQCIRNTIHALPVSHGEQLNQLLSSSRPQMRLINRNTSQQNSSQTRPAQRFSAPRNSRQYVKLYGSNQQGSPSGSLTDQRPRPLLQQQQQSRYSLRSYYGQHTSDRQQQSINGPANSQQTSNQNYQHHHHYHQRSTRNRFSGGKAGGNYSFFLFRYPLIKIQKRKQLPLGKIAIISHFL